MINKTVFLINAMKEYGHSQGQLNKTLHDTAVSFFKEQGCVVEQTIINNGYDIDDEIHKIVKADLIIYQQPAWWMGGPWILKKYMDDVFTPGQGVLYANDGRTRSDDHKKYGSGGLLKDKYYMISATWNAPEEAFTDPNQFFEGAGIDGVYLPFHKANQFIGLKPLPTFSCHDVMKEPNITQFIRDYQAHLLMISHHFK